MKNKWISLLIVMIVLMLTSGCLYPDDQRAEKRVNPQEFILIVQAAVDSFFDNTGVLPIKNSEMNTPIFEKYKLDFKKLIDRGYLSQIPSNAFENGGTDYYVLIDVEKKPIVKVMDMLSLQEIREIERLVNSYASLHDGDIPSDKQITGQWYTIDFARIDKDRVQVRSVYSNQYLGLLVHTTGKVVIDYAPEIMKLINKQEITEVDPEIDLRSFLVENSYYVPAGSNVYYWVENQPVISDQI